MTLAAKVAVVGLLAASVIAALTVKNQSQAQTDTGTPLTAKANQVDPQSQPLPRLLDLGADQCVPCKAMKPILDEMKVEYDGKVRVEFIDVWKDRTAGDLYKVQSIPTQIFFDAEGKELYRHVGFYAKDEMVAKMKELGFKL